MSKSISSTQVLDTDTESTEVESTETTEADFVPTFESLVADYQAGRISKRDAKAFAEQHMHSELESGNLVEAQSWSKLFKSVDSAVRSTGRTSADEIDAEEYVQAIVARATALKQAALNLLGSAIVPGDVPQQVRDEVRDLLDSYTKGEYVVSTSDEILKSASEPVESLAKTRVIGYAKITTHLDSVVAGKATTPNGFPFTLVKGQTYRMSEIANLHTESHPVGVSVGALGNRFTHKQPERFPAGWVYAEAKGLHGTESGVHGLRYVGLDD